MSGHHHDHIRSIPGISPQTAAQQDGMSIRERLLNEMELVLTGMGVPLARWGQENVRYYDGKVRSVLYLTFPLALQPKDVAVSATVGKTRKDVAYETGPNACTPENHLPSLLFPNPKPPIVLHPCARSWRWALGRI